MLWFAEKFVSLLIEQHLSRPRPSCPCRCDLLKNSYLCLLNNTWNFPHTIAMWVVICWKIRIFAYWTTPRLRGAIKFSCCDLLKNSYLCLLNNTRTGPWRRTSRVVICWKIRIFAYWTTPGISKSRWERQLWFAEKFVSLLIEQHRRLAPPAIPAGCDLLKNSYLCLLNNTYMFNIQRSTMLWFAEKFVSLLIEQHRGATLRLRPFSCDLLKNSYLCLLNNT